MTSGRWLRSGRLLGVVLLAALMCWAVPRAEAGVRSAQHEDFGRIAFDWDQSTNYEVEVAGTRLTARFSRPVSGDLQTAVQRLSAYISAAELDAERRTAILTLTSPLQARAFAVGGSVVIDLVRSGASAKADPAQKRSAALSVPIRIGEHDGYTRLVFDWPEPTEYRVNRDGDRVSVRFARAGTFDTAAIQNALPAYVAGFDSEAAGKNALRAIIRVAEGARVRHFAVEKSGRVVLDILRPERNAAAASEAPKAASAKAETEKTPPAAKPEAPKAESTKPTAEARPAPSASTPSAPTPPALTQPAATQPAPPPAPAVSATGGETPPPPGPETPGGAPGPIAVAVQPGAAIPEVIIEEDEDLAGGELDEEGNLVKSEAVSLSITWAQATAAAVFRRAGYLWIVFDRHQEVDLGLLRRLGGNVIQSIEQLPTKSTTVLRIITEPGYQPSVRREGLLWIVDLMRQPLKAKSPLSYKLQQDSPVGARIFIPVTEAGPPVPLQDPEVGDAFFVVPLINLGQGITPESDFPEAELLRTVQGIVVLRKTDNVDVRVSRNGVEISNPPGGIHFSRESDRVAVSRPRDGGEGRAIDLPAWARGNLDALPKNRKELTAQISSLPEGQRTQARLDLARLLIAHDYANEALGVLRILARFDPAALTKGSFRAARGLANFLAGRYSEAVTDLSHRALEEDPEAALWRAASQAAIGEPLRQADILKEGIQYLKPYARSIRLKLAMVGVDSEIQAGDDRAAQQFIEAAAAPDHPEVDKVKIAYAEGRLFQLVGAYDEAIKKYEIAEAGKNRWARARASFAHIEVDLQREKISLEAAAERLERLRFAWRGDEFELEVLRRLVDIYMRQREYGNGLRLLKQIVLNFRDLRDVDHLTALMADTFSALFLEGAADKLPPIAALAVYDEFKELTPPGEKGDEVIRKLSDRMAAVDLLDRAAELLEQQVKYRLTGLEKARVGTRLALVYLLDHKAEKTLAALDATDFKDMPAELALQRKHIHIRALAEVGKVDEALAPLIDDATRQGQLLRTEILWQNKRWPEVALSFETLVAKPKRGEQLSDQDQRFVLNWTTALILAGDERGAAKLRRNFAPAMEMGAYRDVFNLLTAENVETGVDRMAGLAKIKEVEKFTSFLADYRNRIRTEKLSAIN